MDLTFRRKKKNKNKHACFSFSPCCGLLFCNIPRRSKEEEKGPFLSFSHQKMFLIKKITKGRRRRRRGERIS